MISHLLNCPIFWRCKRYSCENVVTWGSSEVIEMGFMVMLSHATHRTSRASRQVDPKANSYLILQRVAKMPTSLSSCSEGVRAASVMPLGQVLGIGPLRRSLAALSACCPPLPTRLANESSRVFWDPRVVRPRGVDETPSDDLERRVSISTG